MEKKKETKDLFSLDYEKDILGCILVNGSDWLATSKTLLGKTGVKAFYSPEAQAIYQACLDLEKKGKVIGLPTVHEVLKKKGKGKIDLPFLESLTSYATENEALFEQELRDIRQFALHRRALGLALTMDGKDYEQINEELREYLEECQEAKSKGKGKKPLSIAEVLKKGVPQIRYLVGQGLLPCEGYSMICGKSKQRKTTLALYLSLCLATQTHVFVRRDGGKQYAFPTVKKAKTLYLYGEAQIGFIMSLFNAQMKGFKARGRAVTEEEQRSVEIMRNEDVFLDTDEGLTALRRLLKAEHYDLVIIDPLTLFVTGDIDKSQSALVIIRALQSLSQEFNCLFLVVHHGRKDRPDISASGDKMDNILGSSVWRGNYESCIFIERWSETKGALIKLCTFEFRNAEIPLPMIIELDSETLLPEPKSKEEALSVAVVDVFRLRDYMNDYFKGAGYPTEITDGASRHFETSTSRIYQLLKEGEVRGVFEKEKGKGGKWRVVKEEKELPLKVKPPSS